ncbi:YggS family pyridoxal phosphate-dependent enzyme [Motilimonas cestriensis]|uniref:Pyridoxal phosphate homeostasis protein n=1 Tax=Motilimonas cestriensis TaxID=2742685 RepID=A0ABS8WB82_9GAMM|nr:YggS family pyridoxal phosphate-dependent enzyme [Motilimonas cestriensis]MCE2596272.1 YggS family pyridoxal phosphate-dependent enzyme [Motilimonas cestriensis]
MSTLSKQLTTVLSQIEQAASAAHRDKHEIKLLAVSKTKPVAQIKAAYAAGQRLFGENYVQEGIEKIQALSQDADIVEPIEWHFIGPLQSNKTKPVAEHFNWVQSIDRLKIAQRLNDQRPEHLAPLNICLQVNISGEASKSGTTLSQVIELASQVSALPRLKLRGIMAIPQATDDENILNDSFQQLHRLYLQLQQTYPDIDTLSMGMSGDMIPAIANGSSMVRVGTAIFGARDYSA